ncbi:BREX system serine/threonine kinase PglW [Actinoplanes bogorensis]|uniref:non-specific serine/threonine protein kinase n=1 Tax=Paractinoplanes bogorensis TaxID=1610840 RepID=A0ABS5YXX6_9ACTN|nr:BREX system serine/threonine kinase PglW [Actinoplanes bogorensis]
MRQDSPRWEEINPSSFEWEKDGLRELASYLPDQDPFHVWANVEFLGTDGSLNEVDALVLTRSGLYVVELKHWQGEIAGGGVQWVRRMPNQRLQPYDNPLILANRKAKRLASLIRYYAKQHGKDKLVPFVGAAVFLHARNMRSQLDAIGAQHIYGLDNHPESNLPSLKLFMLDRPKHGPAIDPARGQQIVELVRGANIRPSVADRKINQLLLHGKPFAEGVGWQDFIAKHIIDQQITRRVRFYLTSKAATEDIPIIKRAAEREFRLLQGIQHPGVSQALDLTEHSFGPAVIFNHDPNSVRLDQWLLQHEDKMTLAQRLQVIDDIAEIIAYAHSRRLAHRALNPQAIYVRHPESTRPQYQVTEWQAGGRLADATRMTRVTSTDGAGLELFFDDDVRRYQAPEAAHRIDVPGIPLDVFSLGAIAYRIFTGNTPAESPEELVAAVSDGGLNLSASADGIPGTLATLVYDATFGDPGKRLASVAKFRERIEQVWDELTAPEPEPIVDPLEAHKGDILEGGWTVVSRLGSGATATALLVSQETGDGKREVVLKVARDEQFAERLNSEAGVLRKMHHHWQVAALIGEPVTIGGRTALVLEIAGERTLAEDLEGGRRLALDLLERYGRDLLDILTFFEGEGVMHRDIKPANLAARPRPSDRQPHLCIFDFSLAAAAPEQITAGTPPYLDPFLGPPRRLRYDTAADRFSAAVTLFEMATGTLPRWGSDANPATVKDEVTLDPAKFEPAIADRLVPFFAKALAREVKDRFPTAEQMADAWRMIFYQIPEPAEVGPGEAPPLPEALSRASALDAVGLTPRALSALNRLGVASVGELLDYEPSALTRAQGVPDATRKEILARVRALRVELSGTPEPEPVAEGAVPFGIEAVAAILLPGARATDYNTVAMLLGQAPTAGGRYLRWLSQSEAATAMGQTQPQISSLIRKHVKRWRDNPAIASIRDEIIAMLDTRGLVMSSEEIAEALILSRGSYSGEPRRTAQAVGLVRVAVEVELLRGGESRVAHNRFHGSGTVLVGREPDDPQAETTANDFLAYAVQLGKTATAIAGHELPLTRQRAIERLRAVPQPEGMPALSEARLLQLAAAATHGLADVNAQGQFYPVGMPAERALRLAVGALVGQKLAVDQLRDRVRARFPLAEPLPNRPHLTNLLESLDVPLSWDETEQAYVPPARTIGFSSTRMASTMAPLAGPSDVSESDAKLATALERNAYLAVLADRRFYGKARRALLDRLPLTELDVTALLIDKLRGTRFAWETIVAADSGDAADQNFRALTVMVQKHVIPAVEELLAGDGPLLITEAAPLARYGQMQLLQRLADPTHPRAAARLLLVPARRPEPVVLDAEQIPLTSPVSQSLWLPDPWINRVGERTA